MVHTKQGRNRPKRLIKAISTVFLINDLRENPKIIVNCQSASIQLDLVFCPFPPNLGTKSDAQQSNNFPWLVIGCLASVQFLLVLSFFCDFSRAALSERICHKTRTSCWGRVGSNNEVGSRQGNCDISFTGSGAPWLGPWLVFSIRISLIIFLTTMC